jgi:hypothetical protein
LVWERLKRKSSPVAWLPPGQSAALISVSPGVCLVRNSWGLPSEFQSSEAVTAPESIAPESMATGMANARALGAGAIFGGAVLLSALPRHVLWPLAALAYPVSLLTFAFLPWSELHAIQTRGEWTPGQLWLVLPTIVFGFALSPNLDLTFHRARQEVPAGARPHNFAVFGVTFASMLVLTCCYAAAAVPLWPQPGVAEFRPVIRSLDKRANAKRSHSAPYI